MTSDSRLHLTAAGVGMKRKGFNKPRRWRGEVPDTAAVKPRSFIGGLSPDVQERVAYGNAERLAEKAGKTR